MNKRYFPHDFDAFTDPKIQNIMVDFGVAGYGAFWYIVELLYQNDGVLPLSQHKAIAFALHLECKDIASIIQDYNLFENDGENFWSRSVNERVERMKKVSESRRNSAVSRWNPTNNNNESKSNANALQLVGKNKSKNKNILLEGENGKSQSESINYQEIVDLWVRHCPELSKPTKMTDTRREKIRIRLGEMGKTIADQFITLETVFMKIGESDFCNGKNDRGWKADFDWVFKNESNWVKVMENKYANKTGAKSESSSVNDIWNHGTN